MTSQDSQVDVVVLGAGPVGENVADRLRKEGLTVAVVESERAGGECSYWACMPSKALLHPVELKAAATRMDGVKQAVSGSVDVDAVLSRRDAFVSGYDDAAQVDWLSSTGATLVRGRAKLAGPKRVEVSHDDGSTTTLTADRAVVVATGSIATTPPVEGIADVDVWTNREGTGASHVPESLLVLGGGAVGCELATAWRRLGSQVTLVQHGERLLPGMEPEAGERVAASLRDDDVDVRLGTSVSSVSRDGGPDGDGGVRAELGDGSVVTASKFLVAAGRAPATRDLGLESVGLDDGEPLAVDDTTLVRGVEGEWLYAAGDCTDKVKLTHMGKYQARVCADVIVARRKGDTADLGKRYTHLAATAEHTAVTQVVFTDPQVAAVGHTEHSANEAGLNIRIVEVETSGNAGGSFYGRGAPGTARMIVDVDRGVICGATVTGSEIADFIHAFTIAIVGEVSMERLWHAVPCFPTRSELWLRLLESYRK